MTPTIPPVAGLPDGVELDKIGTAQDDDFELVGDKILKGPRPLAASGVIVKPADGYVFVEKFDIRDFAPYFVVTKKLASTTVKQTVTFTVDNQIDLNGIHSALAELKKLTGFVSAE